MKLENILKGINVIEAKGCMTQEIYGIHIDSRQVVVIAFFLREAEMVL